MKASFIPGEVAEDKLHIILCLVDSCSFDLSKDL